jgi:hypothetical protein
MRPIAEDRPSKRPVGRYVICYEPIVAGVNIERLLHGARNINAVCGGEPL